MRFKYLRSKYPYKFRIFSAGLTIVANIVIATGPALLGATRCSEINLIHYIIYNIVFNLKYFAQFSISNKRRFSVERCMCPEILA